MQVELKATQVPTTAAELRALILANRGVDSDEERQAFLHPASPLELSNAAYGLDEASLSKAVTLLRAAHRDARPILIYGDYDADGMCATTVVWQTLHALGYKVHPFIPSRFDHGYGLSVEGLQHALEEYQAELVLTVDNGIVAYEAAEWLAAADIPLLITDHHQPDQAALPSARAVVHSTEVCGTVVGWLLMRAVVQAHDHSSKKKQQLLASQLDLLALATVADMMPLKGVNRSIVTHGLPVLQKGERPGLRALYRIAGVDPTNLTAGAVGYQVAPPLNAAGRLEDGLEAVRLLATGSATAAQSRAETLVALNRTRQALTESAIEQALRMAKEQTDEHLLVLYLPEVAEGVIGLVAGRICQALYRPVLVLCDTEQYVKGSARSVSGVHITKLLRQTKEQLLSVGGHAQAAGLSIEFERREAVTARLQELARAQIEPELLVKRKQAECVLPGSLLTVETVDVLGELEPYGIANSRPVFLLQNAVLRTVRPIGREHQHRKALLDIDGVEIESLWWNIRHADDQRLTEGASTAVLATLNQSTWNGRTNLELVGQGVIEVIK